MKQNKFFCFLLILFFFAQAFAVSHDLYPFQDQAEQQRFQIILKELRCLVCQNQNLMDSDAPLAEDLRRQVYRLMQEGKSDQDILAFLTTRYGDFVLYDPPLKSQTYVLWFSPFILLTLGGFILFRMMRKK